jgi:hypothetical protein
VVQTVGLADWVSLPISHSCRYCGINPWFDFLLESLPWFKPGERLSVANGWMCQYPYGKNTGVRTMVQTGGKLTCRNSRTARNDSDELGLDPVVIHVSQPLLESLAWFKPGERLSVATPWCNDSCRNSRRVPDSTRCSCGVCCGVQPRGVTTRVVIR